MRPTKNMYWVERFDIKDRLNPNKFKDEMGWVYPTYSWMTAEEFFVFALKHNANEYNAQFFELTDDYICEHADKLFYEELSLLPKDR